MPKLGALVDEAEVEAAAALTSPLKRINGEIKRRTDVVAIFPNEAAIVPAGRRHAAALSLVP